MLPVSDPLAPSVGESPLLRRAGYLEVFDLSPGLPTEWKIEFTSATNYSIFKKSGTNYLPAGVGSTTADSYSTSREMYILKEWWIVATPAIGDSVFFTTQQSSGMIEMPVLYHGSLNAVAYTNNVVNSVVNEGAIVMAKIDEEDDVNGPLNSYIALAAMSTGFSTIGLASDRAYHDLTGSLHCGSNVIREIGNE